MKKIGLLTTLLVAGLLLTGCNKSVNVENEQERIFACGRSVSEYFGISDYSINWVKEEEAGASFVLNGRVNIGNGIDEEKITKNVQCVIDMVDKSVTILEIDEPVIEEVNIPTFEELNNVVDKCDDDSYDYNVYQKAYILPYKDGYIGYQLGGQDGWELYLTYRKLGEPCNIIAQSDNIFWWNPWYKEGQETFRGASYPDNKIYIAQGLFSGVPTEEIAKELNCEPGKNFEDQDHTCTEEAEKYFYDLMVGNEENEYFTQWMNKLKEDIDNEDYKTFSYYREEYDTCSQKVVDLIGTIQPNQDEKARGEYQVKRTENMHNCVLENLNN